jgi:hypothetical protein
MRLLKTHKEETQGSAPKPRVVVTEIDGTLMAFVINSSGPVQRIPLGDLEVPQDARR